MTAGAWQVRVAVAGDRGEGTLVGAGADAAAGDARDDARGPRAALRADAAAVRRLRRASSRRWRARRGSTPARRPDAARAPPRPDRRRDRRALSSIAAVFFGNGGGRAEATSYARYVYKPLEATPAVTPDGTLAGSTLRDPGWIAQPPPRRLRRRSRPPDAPVRRVAGARSPVASAPERSGNRQRSSSGCRRCPQASYELFADVVHATGVSETITGTLEAPAIEGAVPAGDDSAWAESASTVRLKPDTRRSGPPEADTTSDISVTE